MLIVIWQTFDGFLILVCIINKLDFPVITSLRFMLNLEKKSMNYESCFFPTIQEDIAMRHHAAVWPSHMKVSREKRNKKIGLLDKHN